MAEEQKPIKIPKGSFSSDIRNLLYGKFVAIEEIIELDEQGRTVRDYVAVPKRPIPRRRR